MVRNAMMPFVRGGFGIEPTLDRFLNRTLELTRPGETAEIRELEDKAEIRIELPGVKPEQLSVNAEHRTLSVQAEREGRDPVTHQFTVGPMYDLANVQAKLDLGVLTLTLPKAAEAQPRTIAVQVG
jgi:HSP20 family molecular chaperone IbpA